MANLKLDLLNKINNEKYFDELELVRLAQEPNMNYREKIDLMQQLLENIAIANAELGLVAQYFPDQQPAPQQAPAPQAGAPVAPAGQVHAGQTHGE